MNAIKLIEENAWDLRCNNVPIADTGDYSITWSVYEHHQGKESELLGTGRTPLEAISEAQEFVHGEKPERDGFDAVVSGLENEMKKLDKLIEENQEKGLTQRIKRGYYRDIQVHIDYVLDHLKSKAH